MAGRRPGPPSPQERKSTGYVYDRLRSMVLGGELPAGTPVSQASLAQELGVSRTPLREAARLLQNEGLLVGEPNQRLRVAEVSLEDLDQLYAIRVAAEALALRVAVPKMTGEHVGALEEALEQIGERAVAGGDFDEAHQRFHRLLVEPAGERFAALARTSWDHTSRYRVAYLSAAPEVSGALLDAQHDHRRILEACRAGDGRAAALALADHYERTARGVFAGVDGDFAPAALDEAVASVRRACEN
ncbi:MAG: GntR family transcriptional regulator [Solirubrobacterales bacterium]